MRHIQTDWTSNQELLEQAISLNAQLLALPIREEYYAEVLRNFQEVAQSAQLVNEFPLKSQTQPAPTFDP
jgi:hypothetical protein